MTPLLAAVAFIIWIIDGAPLTFRQERPGYLGRIFKVVKFRTMKDLRDDQNNLLTDKRRVSRLGHFLRTTSLDELPELFNVLAGEMSLVGPRPLLVRYLERYNQEQARRHEVLPGITGWAQINGRNVLSWDEKFSLDVWYVDHWSLALDIRILLLTMWKVIKREGISPPDQMTTDEFMGSDKPQ
jgi:lipopolysaccharide/colanic/teichoic acid biosynthesis glycosyltransferase